MTPITTDRLARKIKRVNELIKTDQEIRVEKRYDYYALEVYNPEPNTFSGGRTLVGGTKRELDNYLNGILQGYELF